MNKNKSTALDSLLIRSGLLLWAAALLLTGYNILDERRAMHTIQKTLENLSVLEYRDFNHSETDIPNYLKYPEMEMPVFEIDGQLYIGILTMPTIELELPVISSWSEQRLKTAPCRYSGSAYLNTLVIAAHNYQSHFGKLNKLYIGAPINFTDADGNIFRYQVMEIEALPSAAVDEMVSSDYDLTLFTCTAGGQKRLTIRCMQIEKQGLL